MALVYNTGTLHAAREDKVWYQWVGTNSTTTMSPTADRIWYENWLSLSNTTNSITLTGTIGTTYLTARDTIWQYWQNAPMTSEQLRAEQDRIQAAREEASRRALAAQQVAAQAKERATELLLSILTDEEARHWQEHGEIQVRSQHGNLYVIERRGVHGNIRLTDEHGCMLGRICVAPRMHDEEGRTLPTEDGWLGQYLMLKHDEDLIIGRGNWSHRRPCQQPNVPILHTREVMAA